MRRNKTFNRTRTQNCKVYFAHFKEIFDEAFQKAYPLKLKDAKQVGLEYNARWLAYCSVVERRKNNLTPVNRDIFNDEFNVLLNSKKRWYHKLFNESWLNRTFSK